MAAAVTWADSEVMGVGSLLPEAQAPLAIGPEAIEILIPGDRAAVNAVYRDDDGRERKAFVRAPMVAVIPPGHACRMQCQRPADTLVLQIAQAFFAEQARAVLGDATPRLVVRFAAFDPFIREVGNALQDEFLQHDSPPNDAYLKPLAGVMAVHLARNYGAAAPNDRPRAGLPPYKLERVQAFVEAHLAEALHVDRMAAEVQMSPFHFSRMFKHATGQPPHLYVVMQRVERAKSLLRGTEMPLVEIAAQTGFRTQGHFSEVFRRYSGFSPRAFRMNCRAAQGY